MPLTAIYEQRNQMLLLLLLLLVLPCALT